MNNKQTLSLLGLALRGGRLAVGEEPVESAARARDARVILLAADAATGTRRRCEHFAQAGQCLWLQLPYTKEELGQVLGRTSVAIAALTDIGLAAALVHRLAEQDPGKYTETAGRLDIKAQRAAERRAEQLAHEKNLRQGKRRPKKAAPAEAVEEPAEAPQKPKAPAPRRNDRPRTESPRKASAPYKSRPPKDKRPKPKAKANPYAHSRPVKKGKGSFRKKES